MNSRYSVRSVLTCLILLFAGIWLEGRQDTLGQDERNTRFLQNLAATCDNVSAANKQVCSDVLALYVIEGVDPKRVQLSPVLKKVLVEVAKKLVGLGSAITGGAGVLLVGTSTATEITDVESETISVDQRRAACVRDMSLLSPDSYVKLIRGRTSRADKILSLLRTK